MDFADRPDRLARPRDSADFAIPGEIRFVHDFATGRLVLVREPDDAPCDCRECRDARSWYGRRGLRKRPGRSDHWRD